MGLDWMLQLGPGEARSQARERLAGAWLSCVDCQEPRLPPAQAS